MARAATSRLSRVVGAWGRAVRSIYDAVASTVSSLTGGYQVLDPRRKVLPRGQILRSASANELATMSLPQLRALCRKLERDNPTARAAVEGLVAQIVGTGIALEPDHGDERVNEALRQAFDEYTKTCDISGRRTIFDLELQACRELVIAGEFIWRTPVLPERAAAGQVPLAVLPLECEWIAQEPAVVPPVDGITAVAGIELDKWGRPVAYRLQNPEMGFAHTIERVEAREIIHDFERRRSLQARGEPWLAPVIERIWQEGDLVDAELRSAINCAAMAIVITSESHGDVDTTEQGTTEDPAQRIGVGAIARLFPGEKIEAFSHSRPAQQIAEFRRTLRGDIASACRTSQRFLDRDYGRANYSSMRMDGLDSERLLGPVREWFGHATIGQLYIRALPYLCVMAGVSMPKRIAYRLVPDGQPYVDPLKDAQAAAVAIAFGLSTWEAEIGKRGGDYRQVFNQQVNERQYAASIGLPLAMPNQATAPIEQDPENDAQTGNEAGPKANPQPAANAKQPRANSNKAKS